MNYHHWSSNDKNYFQTNPGPYEYLFTQTQTEHVDEIFEFGMIVH